MYYLGAYKTGSLLCPVAAAAKVMRLRQSMGAADDDPFLAYGQKQMLTRKTVTEVLRWAAKDLGQVEANFASHSLGIGGASTMSAAIHRHRSRFVLCVLLQL